MIADLTIGEVILLERHRRNMTVKELAELSGVSANAISEYEHNKAVIPTEKLMRICNVLDIQIDSVFSPKQKETGVFENTDGATE